MKPWAEVLLVSYSEIRNTMQDKIGFKCDDVKMEEMAVASIKKALAKGDKSKFFKYIIVDLDEVNIIIERFGRSIKALLAENGIAPHEIALYAVSSTPSDKQEQHCVRANFSYFDKPSKTKQLDTFRHMAETDKSVDGPAQPQEGVLSG